MACIYCSQKEKGRGKDEIPIPLTPDQYDRLSHRLYQMEQKTAYWDRYCPSLNEMEGLALRLIEIERQIKRLEKMFIKIGMKLFQKALP